MRERTAKLALRGERPRVARSRPTRWRGCSTCCARTSAHRHQGGLRRGRVRRLRGARRRRAGEQLPGAGRAGRRRERAHHRGARPAGGELDRVQEAFVERGGAQCGICTPGMMLAAVHLLERNPTPTDDGDPRGARRQPLPLHRLHADLRGRGGGRRGRAAEASADEARTCRLRARRARRRLDEALAARRPSRRVARRFAGGTDLMVLFAAGKLPPGRCLEHLAARRAARHRGDARRASTLGALTTYTDVRRSATLRARASRALAAPRAETGGLAIQNRGTLGGNIANASPAADSPPALLAYDAEIELVSTARRALGALRRLPHRLQADGAARRTS